MPRLGVPFGSKPSAGLFLELVAKAASAPTVPLLLALTPALQFRFAPSSAMGSCRARALGHASPMAIVRRRGRSRARCRSARFPLRSIGWRPESQSNGPTRGRSLGGTPQAADLCGDPAFATISLPSLFSSFPLDRPIRSAEAPSAPCAPLSPRLQRVGSSPSYRPHLAVNSGSLFFPQSSARLASRAAVQPAVKS